eukprot:GHRQ01030895.1.p1 GENE.GHRQ01030895.1~~GHRQ01030895.1.p1  ORF type:complete len:152 (+),score=42.22 GHRQ01030895.1:938-1393(+)
MRRACSAAYQAVCVWLSFWLTCSSLCSATASSISAVSSDVALLQILCTHAVWGDFACCVCCRAAQAVGVLTIIGLAIYSFSNPLAFYWVVLVLALQRGPILPCQEELSEPSEGNPNRGIARALYALPLLVLLPYPVEYLLALQKLPNPSPF